MNTHVINVTSDHIWKGKKDNPVRCPVALAYLEALPWIGVAWVGTHQVDLASQLVEPIGEQIYGPVHKLWHSPVVTAFIQKFDSGEPVEPFSFTIEVEHD